VNQIKESLIFDLCVLVPVTSKPYLDTLLPDNFQYIVKRVPTIKRIAVIADAVVISIFSCKVKG